MSGIVVLFHCEKGTVKVQLVKAKILVLKRIHAPHRIAQQQAKQDTDRAAVHAYQYRCFIRLRHDLVDGGLHAPYDVVGTFASLNPEGRVA